MKEMDKRFYATREDLIPAIQRIESARTLQYTLTGMFETPNPIRFASAFDIPDLGLSRYGDKIGDDWFLVMDRKETIYVEEVEQIAGGVLYDIGLMNNPTAFSFQPGGRFGDQTLIIGSVGTGTHDSSSLTLCKWFWNHLKREFVKVRDCYLGNEAHKMLKQGWRLTESSQSPSSYDFKE